MPRLRPWLRQQRNGRGRPCDAPLVLSPPPALLWLPVYLYRLSLPVPVCLLSTWPLPLLRHYYALRPDCADCIAVRRRPHVAEAGAAAIRRDRISLLQCQIR